MEENKYIKISELCKKVCSGGTPKSSVTSYYDGNIPWLNTKEINFNRIYSTERNITEEGLNNSSAKWIEKNAVVVAMYGATAGKSAISKIPLTTNQACCNLMINPEKADYRFVYYALASDYNRLASLANGGAQQNLNAQQIKDFEIPKFTLEEQKRIADFLSSLDDKIELNRQINDNLEQQAQALFKSWFVDFEPFKDSEFVDSELGMIPKGWEIVPLGDMVSVIDNRGKTPPLSECSTKFPIIDVKALSGSHRIINYSNCSKYVTEDIYNSFFRSGHPDKYDILLSTVGSLAELKIYMINKGTIAQNVVALRSKYPLYLYQYLFNKKGDLISYNIGSVQPSIKVTHIVKYAILLPPKETIINFENILNSLTNQILKNENECQSLESIRDTLLPRLMSGELKIN